MDEAREALRDMVAKALYDSLSPKFEITWKEGYYPAAEALLSLAELVERTCDRKGRESNDWPPEFERMALTLHGPPVPVVPAGETTQEEKSG
jgi:hypothetical protein